MKSVQNYLTKYVFESIIQALIIFYNSLYSVENSISRNGENSDLIMAEILNIYSIILVFNFRVVFTSLNHKAKYVYLSIFIVALLVMAYLISNRQGRVGE